MRLVWVAVFPCAALAAPPTMAQQFPGDLVSQPTTRLCHDGDGTFGRLKRPLAAGGSDIRSRRPTAHPRRRIRGAHVSEEVALGAPP
jgi:hypothetical protein